MSTKRNRAGFTLIEILAVILIIGLLASMLLPALSAAREAARNSQCKSNLRQFGIGFHVYADSHKDMFCSGASDWKRDGAYTEVGWIADMVNSGTAAGQMLCPSNEFKMPEKYNDMLGVTSTTNGGCIALDGTKQGLRPDGTILVNPCRILMGTWTGTWASPWGSSYTGGSQPTGEDLRLLIENAIYKQNYNSNYASSWYMVRSGVSLDKDGKLVTAPSTCTSPPSPSNKERYCTRGPLKRSTAEGAAVSSALIPLLGDGAPGDIKEAILSSTVGDVSVGSRLVESFSDGPVQNTDMKPPSPAAGTLFGGSSGWFATWSKTLQDYRDFAPLHGSKNGTANILFADGHVGSFIDANNDGYLNNGFDPALYTGSAGASAVGYTSSEIELPPEQIFSGFELRSDYKGNLDQQ